jgi:hypothetical protein
VVAADFDGDSILDLAVANQGSNAISVLKGDGRGGFAEEVRYTVGSQPASLAAADLNGDGRMDLVVANIGADSVSVLIGKGDGTFL